MTVISPVQELTDFQYEIGCEMFVPAGRHATPQELGSFILGTYAKASIQQNEDLDAMLIGDYFRYFPGSEGDLIDKAEEFQIGGLAKIKLEQVNAETTKQMNSAIDRARLRLNQLGGRVQSEEDLLLPTAYILSEDAHAGDMRKNGTAYHDHVVRVAAMGLKVARTLEAENLRNDPQRTASEIIIRLHHDAPEETMPAGKHFDPQRKGHFSPLIILRLMEKFGNQYARQTADGLRFITHIKDKDVPWMRDYPDYVYQRVMQNFEAVEAKQDDIFDNRFNEPKQVDTPEEHEKREKKHADYELLLPLLQARSIELAPSKGCLNWIKRGIEIRQNRPPSMQHAEIRELNNYVFGLAA